MSNISIPVNDVLLTDYERGLKVMLYMMRIPKNAFLQKKFLKGCVDIGLIDNNQMRQTLEFLEFEPEYHYIKEVLPNG